MINRSTILNEYALFQFVLVNPEITFYRHSICFVFISPLEQRLRWLKFCVLPLGSIHTLSNPISHGRWKCDAKAQVVHSDEILTANFSPRYVHPNNWELDPEGKLKVSAVCLKLYLSCTFVITVLPAAYQVMLDRRRNELKWKPMKKASLYKNWRQMCTKIRTLVGNAIVDHSDVAGASPVGAAPTTSSFSN